MHTDFIKNLKKSHSVHTLEDAVQKDTVPLGRKTSFDSELNRFPILDSFLGRPSVVQDYNPSLQRLRQEECTFWSNVSYRKIMGEKKSTPLLDELMAVSKHISGGNEHQPWRGRKKTAYCRPASFTFGLGSYPNFIVKIFTLYNQESFS